MDWFRWHHGSVTDPKFQLVAKRAGASVAEVIAVWAYILEHASQAAERGDFEGLDCEAVDLALGMHDGLTGRIIEQLGNRGLISGNRVAAWDKRQPKREDDTANDRKRRQREREHELAMAAMSRTSHDESRNVTQCHARGEESRVDKKEQEQAARATRLPKEWVLTAELEAWAKKERPDVNPALEAEKFRDYWTAQGGQRGAKKDWAATWRNWIRNSKATPNHTPKPPAQDFSAVDKLRASMPVLTDEQRAAKLSEIKNFRLSSL